MGLHIDHFLYTVGVQLHSSYQSVDRVRSRIFFFLFLSSLMYNYKLCIWHKLSNRLSGYNHFMNGITWGIFYEAQHGNSRLPFEKRLGRHIIIIFIFWKQTIFLEKRKPSVECIHDFARTKIGLPCALFTLVFRQKQKHFILALVFLSPHYLLLEIFKIFFWRMAMNGCQKILFCPV